MQSMLLSIRGACSYVCSIDTYFMKGDHSKVHQLLLSFGAHADIIMDECM